MTRRTLFIWLILTLLLGACSLSEDITPPPGAVLPSPSPVTPMPQGALYPLVAPNPASASAIFAEKCAPCHGAQGLGDGIQAADLPAPPAPIGSAQLARQARPADWYQVVTQGRLEKFMPPFSSLTEGQRWDVVAFLLNLHVSAEELTLAETLFAENCAACHGNTGLGNGDKATAPMPSFADQKWMAQRSAQDFYSAIVQGVGENMPAFAENFSEQEVWAIATYLRTLSFQGNATGLQAQNSPVLPPTATQTTQTGGVVTGLVTNASGGTLPQDLTVMLRGFDAMQQTFAETTSMAPDGSFVFSNVPMPMQRAFLVTAEYQDVLYGSDVAVVQEGMMAFDLPFNVYESTRDASVLSIDRVHLFFEFPAENVVRVGQLYVISNLSNKTLISSDDSGVVTAFSLPEGAGQPQFEDGALGERYLPIPNGFGDTVQVRPGQGQYQVFFAVDIPYDGRRLDFKQQFSMPVDAILVMLPEGQMNLSSPYLQAGAPREVQGLQYAVFNGDGIEPTQTLEIALNRRWGAGFSTSAGIILGTAVLGAALLIAGLWMYRRDQQLPHNESVLALADAEDDAAEDINLNTADALMDAILALDDLYSAGQIPEAVYTTRRARLKARLQEMLD